MPITHAMEATRAQRKVKVARREGDSYIVQMTTETDGMPTITSFKLSREALVLLSESLVEFIQNIDQFEIVLEDVE